MPTLTMSVVVDLRVIELLAARLCHELSGPVTAAGTGVEFLLEQNPDLAPEALTLVAESTRRASALVQFYRFAYGFGGQSSAAGPLPYELAANHFAASRTMCRYLAGARGLPLSQQKLGCNLLLFGAEVLARGGSLTLEAAGSGLLLEAAGEIVSLAREQLDALTLRRSIAELSSRTVQPYFTGLLAQAQGWRLVAEVLEPQRLRVTSVAPGC
jgi:histidine phosphotransferase ChpT